VIDPDTLVPELAAFPRVDLGHAPTPLDPAPALGRAFDVDLHVKRDDMTGLAFGGNKVRQLEFYLGEARAAEADVVLITGAVQSNFVRLAAAGARKLGMDIHIQLEERVKGGDEIYRRSGNVFLDRLLGATLHSFAVGEDESAADRALETIAQGLREAGRRPYVIHLGVEHSPIGALGYVRAGAEIVIQCRESGATFDAVVVSSGSGLTHSGLLTGLRAVGDETPVHGVCVRREAELQRPRVTRRVREVDELLGGRQLAGPHDVRVTDATLAPGYGKLNEQTFRAIEAASRLEGLFLDPVYTGKTLAALGPLVEAGEIARGARVLFVHTGGTPALFGYQTAIEPYLSQ
jgi:D-cysteine desulfhydrase/L-cysteate sulfo-lyase